MENKEYQSVTNKGVPKKYSVHDYAAQILKGKNFDELTETEKTEVKNWYVGLDYDQYYVYNVQDNTYKALKTEKDANGKLTYLYQDGSPLEDGVRKINAYTSVVSSAESQFAQSVSSQNAYLLVIFIIVLLLTLVSMATFRSPAVALMPDVTLKAAEKQSQRNYKTLWVRRAV